MSFLQPDTAVFLKGPETYLPEKVISNDDLIHWMGAQIRSSWIEHRTGIRERRWASEEQACSDLGFHAASSILERFPSEKSKIKQLILSTISGDYPTPPTSPLLQERLGLKGIGAFDLGAACAGFVAGLHTASALLIATGQSQLLVSSEIRSKFLNRSDFATSALFGDGAAAGIVTLDPTQANFRILATQLFSDGSVEDIISIGAGGSRLPFPLNFDSEKNYLKMKKGALLFLKAVDGMVESSTYFLSRLGFNIQDIDWVVPHQANLHLLREVARKLEIPTEKVIETVQVTGNTSGASVGIALHALLSRLSPGRPEKILLISAGGGGLAACGLLESCLR